MKRPRILSILPVVAVGGLLAACHGDKSMSTSKEPALYDRLGGKPAITAVVDECVARVAADNRVNGRFASTNIPRLETMLVDQVCEASGGPCKCTGRDMQSAHRGMNLSKREFQITGEHLASALDKFKVPAKEKNELMAAIGSMEGQIVGQ
jgi:hemoglobin